jgi:hypothetical protein
MIQHHHKLIKKRHWVSHRQTHRHQIVQTPIQQQSGTWQSWSFLSSRYVPSFGWSALRFTASRWAACPRRSTTQISAQDSKPTPWTPVKIIRAQLVKSRHFSHSWARMPWARRVEAVIKGYMLLGSDDTDCRLRRTLQQFRGSICAASPVSGPRFLRTCQKALFSAAGNGRCA